MVTVIRRALMEHEPVLLDLPPQQQPPASEAPAAAPTLIDVDQSTDDTDSSSATVAPALYEVPDPTAQEEEDDSAAAAAFAAAEQERQQALQSAFDDGYRAGIAQVQKQFAADLTGVASLLGALRQALDDGVAELEDVAVEIAYEAVGKIIGEAMRSRDGVLAMVQQALRAAGEREQLVVRLAPADCALLNRAGGALEASELAGLELMADDQITPGGCLVTTAGGSLDARLETQFQRLREVLVDARGHAHQAHP